MNGRVFTTLGDPVEFANVFSLTRPGLVTSTDENGNWSAPFVHGELIRVTHVATVPWQGQAQDAALLQVSSNVQDLPGHTVTGKRPLPWWAKLGLLWLLAYAVSDDN